MGLFPGVGSAGIGDHWKALALSALAAASKSLPRLAQVDYALLQNRALEQRDYIEAKRLQLACEVLAERTLGSLNIRAAKTHSGRRQKLEFHTP